MIFNDNDCIAAISTPAGTGGIAIIRLSGQDAFSIADKMISRSKKGVLSAFVSEMADHTIEHCYVFDFADPSAPELIDECLVSKMAAPRTYTTENVVEINSHAGLAVVTRILDLALRCGARAAEPGEFTRRAFLGGRIDLSSAEAVIDVINAKTEDSRKAAVSALSGTLGAEINSLCALLSEAIADLDVSIDYPEYEFDAEMGALAADRINTVLRRLKTLSDTYYAGRIAKEGLRMVIAGPPNAGKSTLMNTLCGVDRSIVTDIPGTTRDTIEEFLQLEGIPVWVTDTAGIHETDDTVEKIGISRTISALSDANIVLYVIDPDSFSGEEDVALAKSLLDPVNSFILINKADIPRSDCRRDEIIAAFAPEYCAMNISAKTGLGLDALLAKIKQAFRIGAVDFGYSPVLTSSRHKQLIDQAISLLEQATGCYSGNMPLDFVSYDIRQASGKLCEITGKNVTDEIINSIFDRFCVGK